MKSLDSRLSALEAASKQAVPSPYPWPLPPGMSRLSVLVLDGPTAEQEVAAWRAQGYEAVIESEDPLAEAFIG